MILTLERFSQLLEQIELISIMKEGGFFPTKEIGFLMIVIIMNIWRINIEHQILKIT